MTAHTPGPYEIWGEDEQVPGVPCIEIGRGKVPSPEAKSICLIQSTLNEDADKFLLTKEDWANAHLLAAAPDLITALRNITALAQNMRDALEVGAPVEIIPNAYFNAAYTAIRNAENS